MAASAKKAAQSPSPTAFGRFTSKTISQNGSIHSVQPVGRGLTYHSRSHLRIKAAKNPRAKIP
jgi:hypothetical protein